jgi:hypothetical protein
MMLHQATTLNLYSFKSEKRRVSYATDVYSIIAAKGKEKLLLYLKGKIGCAPQLGKNNPERYKWGFTWQVWGPRGGTVVLMKHGG